MHKQETQSQEHRQSRPLKLARMLAVLSRGWVERGSLYAFTTVLLAQMLTCASAPYQRELCSALDQALRPGGRLLGALPREHGKSTFGTVALILRELCMGSLDAQQRVQTATAVVSAEARHFTSDTNTPSPAQLGWRSWRICARVMAPPPAKTGNTRRAAGGTTAASASPGTRAGMRHRPRTGAATPFPGVEPGSSRRPRAGVDESAGEQHANQRAANQRDSYKANILIVGANQQEANAKLRLIVQELEKNPLLHAWFGAGILPLLDLKGQRVAYSDSEIVLASGARVKAVGFGAKVRGQLFGGRRPDLVVLDDPEDDRAVASPTARRRLRSWCDTALLNSLDVTRGSLVWLGTLLRHDAVLAQWLGEKVTGDRGQVTEREGTGDRGQGTKEEGTGASLVLLSPVTCNLSPQSQAPHWNILRMAALNEHDAPLWPARWSYETLMQRRAEIGSRAFAQEYLNQPLSLELIVFKDSDWRVYDSSELALADEGWAIGGEPLAVAIGVDPAIGPASGASDSGHDYSAIVVVGLWQPDDEPHDSAADGIEGPQELRRRQPRIYVLDVMRERLPFAEQLRLLEQLCARWRARQIGIEAVAYQQALSQSALSRGLPALAMPETRGKAVRIEAMARHVAEGRVLLPAGGQWVAHLRHEAGEYPAGAHDDQLDALARAIEVALSLGSGRREVEGAEERRGRSVMRRF